MSSVRHTRKFRSPSLLIITLSLVATAIILALPIYAALNATRSEPTAQMPQPIDSLDSTNSFDLILDTRGATAEVQTNATTLDDTTSQPGRSLY